MRQSRFILTLFLSASLLPGALYAQESNQDLINKIDRLQREVSVLQRQLARGETVEASGGDSTGSAHLGNSLTGIEEELRALRGKIEENEFQIRRIDERFERLQTDVDFRFNEMAGATAGAAAATTTTPKPEQPAATTTLPKREEEPKPEPKKEEPKPVEEAAPSETTAGDGVLKLPEDSGDAGASPRELYNHAFRLLNETKYQDAANAFDTFVRKYPKDPLIGNAYYWKGETYYIQRDYVTAADNFRQGFEALPDGPKAPDNLLKLAMSLEAIDQKKESCVVLKQITTRFKKVSTSVTDKAIKEQKRIGCGG